MTVGELVKHLATLNSGAHVFIPAGPEEITEDFEIHERGWQIRLVPATSRAAVGREIDRL